MLNFKLLIVSLFVILLSGCTGSYELDEAIKVNVTNVEKVITIENLWENCVHKSFGDDCYVVRKFGESANIGSTPTPISNGNVYQAPMNLTSVEISSDNVNDVYGGTGAWSVAVTGLSTNWSEVTEIIELNGTTPVTLSNQFYRIYRMYIVDSGTYAGQTAGSHQGDIEIRGVVGGELWATITINGVALGQSEIGLYTIPKGYHAHLGNLFAHNNGNKVANIYMFQRINASDVIAPYGARRILFQIHGLVGGEILMPKSISGAFSETTDLGFMANTDTGTTEVSVDFELLLIKGDHKTISN